MNKIAILSQRLTFEMGEDYHRFISHPVLSPHTRTHEIGVRRESVCVCVCVCVCLSLTEMIAVVHGC